MSSAPASALLSIAAAPALPSETAAPAAPLDPSQTSAFSRMLEAEASLAQAVTPVPASLVPAETAASESAPLLVADHNTDSANDIAVALSQAAQAGLSPIPVAEETPDLIEVPNTDVSPDLELEMETPSENKEELAAPRSTSTRTEVPALANTRAPQVERASNAIELAAPAVTSNPTAKATPVESARASAPMFNTETEFSNEIEPFTPMLDAEGTQEFKVATGATPARMTEKELIPPEPETSECAESNFLVVQSSDTQNATSAPTASVPSPQKSEDFDTDHAAGVAANANVQLQQAAPRAATRTPEASHVAATPARAENMSRVNEHEESNVERAANETGSTPIPIELFLGAAGVLNSPAPRHITSEPLEAEVSDDTQIPADDSVDADFTFASNTRFTPAITTSKEESAAASQNDFAADVDNATIQSLAASREVGSDAVADQEPAFIADLGDVRVISSQNSSRKNVHSVGAEDTKQKEIEFQPLRTELRTVAVDKKSGETVAEPATKAAEFARVLSGWNGEKIARQSSPEGFSTAAVRSEISASTITAPFVDGGRPETIASRNSSEPTPTASPSRAERLLDHTLDAIPNPLRVTTFEIKPEGHGAIRVRISARGEGEKAVWRVQIQTSDPAARSLLSEHLNELRERLPAENVQVELRGANDVRPEVSQRENGGSRERNGEQRQSRGEEQQRQPKQQKSGTFLEWLAAQE